MTICDVRVSDASQVVGRFAVPLIWAEFETMPLVRIELSNFKSYR